MALPGEEIAEDLQRFVVGQGNGLDNEERPSSNESLSTMGTTDTAMTPRPRRQRSGLTIASTSAAVLRSVRKYLIAKRRLSPDIAQCSRNFPSVLDQSRTISLTNEGEGIENLIDFDEGEQGLEEGPAIIDAIQIVVGENRTVDGHSQVVKASKSTASKKKDPTAQPGQWTLQKCENPMRQCDDQVDRSQSNGKSFTFTLPEPLVNVSEESWETEESSDESVKEYSFETNLPDRFPKAFAKLKVGLLTDNVLKSQTGLTEGTDWTKKHVELAKVVNEGHNSVRRERIKSLRGFMPIDRFRFGSYFKNEEEYGGRQMFKTKRSLESMGFDEYTRIVEESHPPILVPSFSLVEDGHLQPVKEVMVNLDEFDDDNAALINTSDSPTITRRLYNCLSSIVPSSIIKLFRRAKRHSLFSNRSSMNADHPGQNKV